MALLDLSLVTKTLIGLITTHVANSPGWAVGAALNVVPLPPDKLTGTNMLGFYLYHVSEDTTGKHTYIPGVSDVPVRFNALGLNLYYVLTAHSEAQDEDVFQEQLMMGLAMKALHDYPQVEDDTTINGTLIMQPALRGKGNAFRLGLLPIKAEHAVSYWMAGSQSQRLAAYYHVAVIKIEPEIPSVRAGRVLTYNIFVLPGDAPRIDTTANVVTFTIPGETDPHSFELRPAQVSYGQGFTVIGSAFTGSNVFLQIRRADWAAPVTVDAAWNVIISANRIAATLRPTASGQDIVPGVYAASVRVERSRTVPSGTRSLESSSNESPFTVAPTILTISAPDAQGRFTVTGSIFQHTAPALSVDVYIDASKLTPGTAATLQPGEFAVIDATHIAVRLPGGLTAGQTVGFRLIINGAESEPRWVTAP